MHSSNGTLKSLKCLFPPQGTLSFALPFLPTSKKVMWSSGRKTRKTNSDKQERELKLN